MRAMSTVLILVSLDLLMIASRVGAYDSDRIPRRPLSQTEIAREDNMFQLIGKIPVLFYRSVLSPVYGSRCRMRPSCSSYCLQAMEKHGAVLGLVLTFDRLLHEGNEYQVSPVVVKGGGNLLREEAYVYDPVDNNTFWW